MRRTLKIGWAPNLAIDRVASSRSVSVRLPGSPAHRLDADAYCVDRDTGVGSVRHNPEPGSAVSVSSTAVPGAQHQAPLPQVVDAEHRLDAERRPTRLRLRVVRLADLHQRAARHHALYPLEELALARLLGRQVQAESELLHVLDRRRASAFNQDGSARGYADPSP